MSRKQFALIAWLCLPVVAAAILYNLIASGFASQSRFRMAEMFPPTGAGAGDTGGVNAVGELAAGNPATHGVPKPLEADGPQPDDETYIRPEILPQGFEIVVEDKTGQAGAESPIYLSAALNGWAATDPQWAFVREKGGTWRLHVPRGAVIDPPLRFRLTLGPHGRPEASASGSPVDRQTPLLRRSEVRPGVQPRLIIQVERWMPPSQ